MGVVTSTLLVVASNDISVSMVWLQIILFYSDGMVCKDSGILLIRHLTTRGVEKHSERGYGRTLNAAENWTIHCSLWEHGLYIPIVQWCLSSPLVDTHKMDCSSEESPSVGIHLLNTSDATPRTRTSVEPMALSRWMQRRNDCRDRDWDLRIQVRCCDDGWWPVMS